jgi:BirA family biotin operon repressor/biotin-[acetyl-CoA-carboxylase] ligase
VGLRQTAGRGRRGRAWETGDGNLAATLLFSTDKPPAEAAQVSFVAALAVADLLAAYVPASLVSLKWPNDPLLGGLKVSGILVESGSRPTGGLWIAVGVGVNLARKPIDSERPATALTTYRVAPPPSPDRGDRGPGRRLRALAGRLAAPGLPRHRRRLDRPRPRPGRACVARLGTETLEGIAEGLDGDGALRLRLADGQLRRVTAGDVFFGEAS